MQLIYAMGEPGQMTFGVTSTPMALPTGAVVYAICDGTSVVERVDEYTYSLMTEIEYLTFKQMVTDAWRHESKRAAKATPTGAFQSFLRWLSGSPAPHKRTDAQAY